MRPGGQTIDLARLLPAAPFVALDLHVPLLEDVQRRMAATAGAWRLHRVQRVGEAALLPVADGT